jgi:hypothetical protein
LFLKTVKGLKAGGCLRPDDTCIPFVHWSQLVRFFELAFNGDSSERASPRNLLKAILQPGALVLFVPGDIASSGWWWIILLTL